MNVQIRKDLEDILREWDSAIIDGCTVPGVFEREFVDVLEVSGTSPVFRVAQHMVSGEDAIVQVVEGTVIYEISTVDQRIEGPFTVRVIQAEDRDLILLVLEDIPGG